MKRLSFNKNSGIKYNNNKNVAFYLSPNVAFVKLNTSRNGKTLILNRGATRFSNRRKGIGKYLRAHIIKAAKNAGYVFVEQSSVNLETGNVRKKPPSAYMMNKLGGTRTNGNEYHYVFNLRRNLPRGTRNALYKKPRV